MEKGRQREVERKDVPENGGTLDDGVVVLLDAAVQKGPA